MLFKSAFAISSPQNALVKVRNFAAIFFFISGAAALIYEVLWTRLLGLVFGNTTFAISTVLAAYMAGLGFGSFWGGRLADRWRKSVLIYGCLEIGIGIYAALTLPLLAFIQSVYIWFAQNLHPSLDAFTAVRFALSFIILFVPTFLMGATLPVLTKFFVKNKKVIGAQTAFLYGLNTAGAVLGTVLTGFFFLPEMGIRRTLIVAVTLNAGIGLLACILSRELESSGIKDSFDVLPEETSSYQNQEASSSRPKRWLLGGLFLSGVTAMIYEVAWTRILASVLGSTTYAFTTMLATFLFGIALGSMAYEKVLAKRCAQNSDWGWLQMILAGAALIALPFYQNIDLLSVRFYGFSFNNIGFIAIIHFFICSAFMFMPAFCFGALFPLSVALYTNDMKVVGRHVGTLYLFNTLGNIIGSVSVGFILIPLIGIYRSILCAILLSALLGVVVLLGTSRRLSRKTLLAGLMTLVMGVGIWSLRCGWDPRLITAGLHIRPQLWMNERDVEILCEINNISCLFYREGLNSIVSVSQIDDHRDLRVNGKPDATNDYDMVTQMLLGHLPHILHPHPRKTMIIGFGSGATLAAALAHPIEKVDCVEIEPAVIDAAPFFDDVNRKAYQDPRTRLILNDGRNHLLVEKQNYDVIVSEPSNPWMAGIANLYSVEFYDLVNKRLAQGGLFCQWIQMYQIAPEDVQMIIASVKSVFPHVGLWVGCHTDILLIAGRDPLIADLDGIQKRIDDNPLVRKDLESFGVRGAAGILSYFRMGEKSIESFVRGARLNTDDQLILEFNAPKFLYEDTGKMIYESVKTHLIERFPPMNISESELLRNPKFLTAMGTAWLAQNEIANAERCFHEANVLEPDNLSAIIGLGQCYVKWNQFDKAKPFFERVIQKDPKQWEARQGLGQVYSQEEKYDEALQSFESASQIEPARWELYYDQALMLQRKLMWKEAAALCERSLQLNPNVIKVSLSYILSLRTAGLLEEAFQVLQMLRVKYPLSFQVLQEFFMTCRALGKMDPAIEAYEDFVRTNPYHGDACLNLIDLYIGKGDIKNATRVLRHLKKINPLMVQMLSLSS